MPFTIPAANKTQGQAGFMPDVDNAWAALAALGTGNVQNAAYAGGATGNGSTDDTAAIQNAENTLNAAGGGVLVFPPGTYSVTGLVKQSNVLWQGSGRGSTVIKLAAGINAPLLVSANFASLSLSGSNTGGVTGFAIRDIALDGNAANQSTPAAAGVQIFGFDYLLENVSIRNFLAKDGLYTEWGPSGQPGPEGAMESHYRMLRIHGNTLTGAGWHNRGPHDSHVFGCFIYQNTTNAYGYWPESSTGTFTATGLSGTAVSATPATITVNTTLGLPASGSFTMASAGGTVTITYTGVTATTFTGCVASGGGGNYTSNTITVPQYSATSALISQMHVWGNHSIAMVLDSESHMSNCEAEGAATGQVLARAGNITWDGGRIFLAGQPGYGLQLGDATNTVTGFALNNPVISGFQGGSAANAAINIVATASGSYRAQIFQSSGQAIYGTFQPYERRAFAWGGTTTPSLAAAAGAGTGPPAPTLTRGSDNRGEVNMGTGTAPGAGSQATVTFAQPKPGTPSIAVWPVGAAAAALQPYVTGASTTGFNIAFAVAPAASQAVGTYVVGYGDVTG